MYCVVSHCGKTSRRGGGRRRGNVRTGRGNGRRKGERTAYRRNRFFGLHSHRRDADHVTRTCADHELLARAVLAGNADAAEAAMREHIRHSMADALAQFDRA